MLQWQNNYGIKTGKKQAGYGMQSHSSLAEMDVAQPLSPDAKVHFTSRYLTFRLVHDINKRLQFFSIVYVIKPLAHNIFILQLSVNFPSSYVVFTSMKV